MSSIERLSMTPEQYEAAKADILERIKEPLVSKPDVFRSHTCGDCAWRPIEEAPKDGTKIIGWCAGDGVELISWRSVIDYDIPKPGRWRDEDGWSSGATHWMPLPTPPAPAPQQEGLCSNPKVVLMAWIEKLADSPYYSIRWRENGRVKSKSTKEKRESAAKTALAKFERQLAENRRNGHQFPDTGKMVTDPRVEDFWKSYVDCTYRRKLRKSSLNAKRHALNRLCKEIGPIVLSDITHEKIVALRASWDDSPVTFNDYIRNVNTLWKFGQKHKLHGLEQNPFEFVARMDEPAEDLPVLTLEQIERILWYAYDHLGNETRTTNVWTMFLLTGFFGLRSIEAENARWEWINWRQSTFNVTQTADFITKNRKNRTIPLFDSAKKWLEPLKQDTGYLFRPEYEAITPRIGRTVDYNKAWNYVCKLAGHVDATGKRTVYPHLLRHSWITNLLYLGASPHEVADWSGHQDLYIQQNYRHAIKPKEGRTSLL